MRVGYGVFPLNIMPHLWKIKQPYNVSVAGTVAAVASLEHAPELEHVGQKIVQERDRLFEGLRTIPFLDPYPSQANFILNKVLEMDASKLKIDLSRAGILVRYFDKPGLQDHIRVTVGKPEQTDKLLKMLAEME
jgi:histidinol-phosphate aminotransferase